MPDPTKHIGRDLAFSSLKPLVNHFMGHSRVSLEGKVACYSQWEFSPWQVFSVPLRKAYRGLLLREL
jgi:hypothetical protein